MAWEVHHNRLVSWKAGVDSGRFAVIEASHDILVTKFGVGVLRHVKRSRVEISGKLTSFRNNIAHNPAGVKTEVEIGL